MVRVLCCSPMELKKVGEWKDGVPHGHGTFAIPDEYEYVGEFKDGCSHGQGTCKYSDGSKYVGEWKDDVRHGQGTFTIPDESEYVGEWKDGEHHGQGTCEYAGGMVYDGEWKGDTFHGHGTMKFPNGGEKVGEWKEGFIPSVILARMNLPFELMRMSIRGSSGEFPANIFEPGKISEKILRSLSCKQQQKTSGPRTDGGECFRP